MGAPLRRWGPRVLGTVVLVLLAIQLVPYGRDHGDPGPGRDPVVWPTPEAADAFAAACADCHSNDTDWPWYSHAAPMSWLVTRDVEAGRDEWNVSDGEAEDEADDAIELVESGAMPPWQYELAHPDARLDAAEQAALVAALRRLDDGDEREDDERHEDDDRSGDTSGPG